MKKSQSKPNKIVAIDLYEGKLYRLRGAEISEHRSLPFRKEYDYTSYISAKDMIIDTIKIDFKLDENDISGAIENIAYDELGLDSNTEYIVRYVQNRERSDSSYQVFIIEKDKLEDILSKRPDGLEYIDEVLPAPLVYRRLYTDLLESRGVHCFIYFSKHDAFITFYENGQYIYAKSIPYSLEYIFTQYTKNSGESMSLDNFLDSLVGKRDTRDSEFKNSIMKIFGDAFVSFNDIVVYVKRAYGIGQIDRLYIGSSAGDVVGLSNFSENYFGLKSFTMRFNFGFYCENKNIDQFTEMLLDRGVTPDKSKSSNFTLYSRPPAIYKRASGQLIGVLLAASILGLMPSAYHYIFKKVTDGQTTILRDKAKKVRDDVEKYKQTIKEKNTTLQQVSSESQEIKKRFEDKEKTLISIYNKKVNYKLKSEQFSLFANDLNQFGIKTYELKSSGDSYSLFLIAKNDKKITEFISYIAKRYDDKIKLIDIGMIARDEVDGNYQGLLKVDFK